MLITRSQRGLTLIELMVTLAIAGIVMTVIAGSFVSQQTVYLRQQQYSEAQQNARAALSVMQQYIREAGWGFAPYVKLGPTPIGRCSNAAPDQCNNLDDDGSSDRLGIMSVKSPDNDPFILRSSLSQPGAGSLVIATGLPVFAVNDKVIISGTCSNGTNTADLVTITNVSSAGDTTYTFNNAEQTSCPGGYAINFNVGRSKAVEFYIDRSEASPRLMLDDGGAEPHVLAYDIEDLQVQYGVDSETNNGTAPNAWCDDLTACPDSVLPTTRENQERIVAVRIAIVARTREELTNYVAPSLTVFDHEIAGDDGYRRWVYRGTIALRNMHPFVEEVTP